MMPVAMNFEWLDTLHGADWLDTLKCDWFDDLQKPLMDISPGSLLTDDAQPETFGYWKEESDTFLRDEKDYYSPLPLNSSASSVCKCYNSQTKYCYNETCSNYALKTPLLRDLFLTTPFFDRTKSTCVENASNTIKIEDETPLDVLERLLVDPNEIFGRDCSSAVNNASSQTKNSPIAGLPASDATSSSIDNLSYDDLWLTSDSDESPLSSSQPSEEETDEIDVVSVFRSKEAASPSAVHSSVFESRILPATPLMSERVAALHNYSTRPAPCVRSSVERLASAPHSPSDRMVPVVTKRSMSHPSSPVARSTNRRRRRGIGEKQKGRMKRFKSDVDYNKRALHNKLEQTRRTMLMGHFHQLRDSVPSIRGNPRASKSDILNNGRVYIQKLQDTAQELDAAYRRELKLKEKLEKALETAMYGRFRRQNSK